VFPLREGGKAPHPRLAPRGFKNATTDPTIIKRWWRDAPRANVGVVTGSESGLVVIDVDPGAPNLSLPSTRKVKTPRGGVHVYYKHPGNFIPNSAGKLAEHVDVRGDGGYVVAPPSVVNKKRYRLLTRRSVASLPPELLPALGTGRANPDRPASGRALPGGRHETLVSMAGRLRSHGLDGDAIYAILQPFNERACVPPKNRSDVHRIAHDIAGRYAPDEASIETEILRELRRLEVRQEAQRRIAAARAGSQYQFPAAGRTLEDDLAHPPVAQKYTVAELHTAGGNTLLVAQFKAGKTTLALNLIAALADEEPFLGAYDVTKLSGSIAWWNYELSADMAREWIRDIGVRNPQRVAEPLHLRGAMVPLWQDDVAERAVKWLRDNEVEFWIIDPAARAMRGLVDNENDNSQIAAFTDALDQIKREAGVLDLVLPTHMGRATVEEDAERSRGATRLEDWMDHGWYLTKDGKPADAPRALRAMGRDVDVSAFDLAFDNETRRLGATGKSRAERRAYDGAKQVVAAVLKLGDGAITSAVMKKLGGHKGDSRQTHWINDAVKAGFIERRYDDGTPVNEDERRIGVPLHCFVTPAGRATKTPPIELKRGTGH
jgi:hypothetical protein